MSVHSTIKSNRLKLGLTEQQLADRVGVTRAAVQQWEREGGTAPKRSKQVAVAEALGITVAELMCIEVAPPPAVSLKEPAKTYIMNGAWPFESVTPDEWRVLTERQKGEIEGRIKELARASTGSGAFHEKSQKAVGF